MNSVLIHLEDNVEPGEFKEIADQIAGFMSQGHHVLVAHAPEDIPEPIVRAAMNELARAVRRGRPVVVAEVPGGMEIEVARARVSATLTARR